MSDFTIGHVTDQKEGPMDGVYAETKGTYTMKSGKNMPVDMALHNYKKDSTGKEKIVTPDGEVVAGRILVGERGDGAGYISHFASCKKYRR